MLNPGDKAPAFALSSDTSDVIRLEDLKGRKVVLYFYPKDDTSGCTVEACEFRDNWAAVKRTGALVLGVSPDGIESHQKFKRKFELQFPLLADPDHAVAEKYGAWGEKSMYGRKYFGIKRMTFVIDEEGRIATVFEKVKPKGHAKEVLEALR
jgi:thioredoxin-dependent peroxiredoxin